MLIVAKVSAADPGFPVGLRREPTLYFDGVFDKLHEIENNWYLGLRRGEEVWPLISPMVLK